MKKSTAIGIFCALGAVIIGLGAYTFTLDSRLERSGYASAAYGGAAAGELTAALSELDGHIAALDFAGDPAMQSALCARAGADAAGAVAALTALPGSAQELEALADYINAAGDYALSLARTAASGQALTDDDREALGEIGEAVSYISREMGGIYAALDSGELLLDDYGAALADADGTLGAALLKLDAALSDFPELEYDGVYAARTLAAVSDADVSETEARQKAAAFLGASPEELDSIGLTGGELPCWAFERGGARIYVAQYGGAVVSLTGACSNGEARIDGESAGAYALGLVEDTLGGSFELVSAEKRGGELSYVFAPVESGALLLCDTVSVGVDAATGLVCSYNAVEYLRRGAQRALEPAFAESEARGAINPALSVEGSRLVLTTTDGGDEALCWKFDCANGSGERAGVYVDAQTGREIKIELAQA